MINSKRHRISVTFDEETFKQFEHIAHRENRSISSVIRDYSMESLKVESNTENIDMITKIIREQLRDVMQPSVERLAALSAKTCIQSATAAYLTAETINKFVPLQEQEDFIAVYEAAKKKAVEYTKSKV